MAARDFTACGLHIPHKRWAVDAGHDNGHQEEDNYAYLEQWSLRMRPCYVKGGGTGPAPGSPILLNVLPVTAYVYPPEQTQVHFSTTPIDPYELTSPRLLDAGYPISYNLPAGNYSGITANFNFFESAGLFPDPMPFRQMDMQLWSVAGATLINSWHTEGNISATGSGVLTIATGALSIGTDLGDLRLFVTWGRTGGVNDHFPDTQQMVATGTTT